MIRICTSQLEVLPGQVRDNFARMEKEIEAARAQGADILIFPELCLSGCLIGDVWEQPSFLRELEAYQQKLIAASSSIVLIWGNVATDESQIHPDGRVRTYNAAFAAFHGRLLSPEHGLRPFIVKTLLPSCRQFDEARYFSGTETLDREGMTSIAEQISPIIIPVRDGSLRAGLVLWEDSWDENTSVCPMDILAEKKADLLINLSASPFTLGKNKKRHRLLEAKASRLHLPILYVNQRGVQNNGKDVYTFDGMTAAYSRKGALLAEAPPYETERMSFTFDIETKELRPEEAFPPYEGSLLLPAMRYGVKHFLSSIHQDRVVIGVSGGIDSAVNAALYRSVLPEEQILLVNMPTRYNAAVTKELARELANNLGSPYVVVPVGSVTDATIQTIEGLSLPFSDGTRPLTLSPVMRENIRARDRSSRILSGLSSAFGGIFTCNANKTELSIGYGTLYGDLAGALAATADLWKHQIYELGRTLNAYFKAPVIPEDCFTIRPSAELSEAQDITKGLGDPLIYDYHDYLFRSFSEAWERKTPEDILAWYAEGSLEEQLGTPLRLSDVFKTTGEFISDLEHWWRLFAGFAVAKRIQSPPLLAISRRPFGSDLREAQLTPYFTDRYYEIKQALLSKEK